MSRRRGSTPAGRGTYLCIELPHTIWFNDALRLDTETWLGVFALATLVLAIGAPRLLPLRTSHLDQAATLAALHWWTSIRVGRLPDGMEPPPVLASWGRLPLREIADRLKNLPPEEIDAASWSLTGRGNHALLQPAPAEWSWRQAFHEEKFAEALVDNARRVLEGQQHACQPTPQALHRSQTNAARAWRWLLTHYPLLAPLLMQFEMVEDIVACQRLQIHTAAIHIGAGRIYLNPARQLSLEQYRFVIAHEILHAGLNHSGRRRGRDPFLWNVACDFVINDWLVGMRIGTVPPDGVLLDEGFQGWAAEDIYLRLSADLRIRRRLATLRGDSCDLLDDTPAETFGDRETVYRTALLRGLEFHQSAGRGLLPSGLVEEIRALVQPPIPWQARLAEWVSERFPLPERKRSYARPSRRQSALPDTPRPKWFLPQEEQATRTFAVIIDTSGSMTREDLGKALGAVVSFASAHEVRQVRLVYCDAAPCDEGYVAVQTLAQRVKVRGRGGTALQPAVLWLERQADLPRDAPILIVTDGLCEADLRVSRDHAFLLAPGRRLPFRTISPVFYMG